MTNAQNPAGTPLIRCMLNKSPDLRGVVNPNTPTTKVEVNVSVKAIMLTHNNSNLLNNSLSNQTDNVNKHAKNISHKSP